MRSPDLKRGIIFAILSFCGTWPVTSDLLKIWLRGVAMLRITFFKKIVEMPLKSWVAFSVIKSMASKISLGETGSFEKFRGESTGCSVFNNGVLTGWIWETILLATFEKKILKCSAINKGLLTRDPPMIIFWIELSFLDLLLTAFLKRDQVFFRLDWCLISSDWKYIFLLALITLL